MQKNNEIHWKNINLEAKDDEIIKVVEEIKKAKIKVLRDEE